MSKSGLVFICVKFAFSYFNLRDGGPGWTRTSDPTLIKRVL